MAVTKIMIISDSACRSRRAASIPSIPGIRISRRRISGRIVSLRICSPV
jgi:hypothetical protein